MKTIVFTTGGTGGHIYPALALAEKFKEEGYDILFIGSIHRMEEKLVKESGYNFKGYDIVPINSFTGIKKQIKAIIDIFKLFSKLDVKLVIGFGNYISLPALIAAKLRFKKIFLQEQNVEFGKANKLMRWFAKRVYLAFPETKLKNKKYIVTGNPLRKEFIQLQSKKVDDISKKILITGGSLGAKNINEAFLKKYKIFIQENIQVYWSTGKEGYKSIVSQIDKEYLDNPKLVIKEYFDDMPKIMSEVDLLVCRAGALTISEIICLHKPSILIPYDYVGQNQNADILVSKKCAYKYDNKDVLKAFEKAFMLLSNKKELISMRNNLEKMYVGNAVDIIYNDILKFIK